MPNKPELSLSEILIKVRNADQDLTINEALHSLQVKIDEAERQGRFDFAVGLKGFIDAEVMGEMTVDEITTYLDAAIRTLKPQLEQEI